MANIPSSVWEQIPVVVVVVVLIYAMYVLMMRVFSNELKAIHQNYAAIIETNNKTYSETIETNNRQWQQYIDARAESAKLLDGQTIKKLKDLTAAIQHISDSQDAHDLTMRQALDKMETKRKKLVQKIPK